MKQFVDKFRALSALYSVTTLTVFDAVKELRKEGDKVVDGGGQHGCRAWRCYRCIWGPNRLAADNHRPDIRVMKTWNQGKSHDGGTILAEPGIGQCPLELNRKARGDVDLGSLCALDPLLLQRSHPLHSTLPSAAGPP
jgi:hypothetical protein